MQVQEDIPDLLYLFPGPVRPSASLASLTFFLPPLCSKVFKDSIGSYPACGKLEEKG